MPDYSIYGLGLRMREPIPGVKPVDRLSGQVIEVSWTPYTGTLDIDREQWTKVEVPPSRRRRRLSIFAQADGSSSPLLLLLHPDNFGDVACIFDEDAGTLDIHHADDMSHEDACSYFLGTVLGFVLRTLGRFALHASAVEIEGRAVLFIGPKGAGKSTTAAAVAYQQGAEVVSDDVAVLDFDNDAITVHRAYGGLRLHEDALSELTDKDASMTLPVYSFVTKSYVFPSADESRDDTDGSDVPVEAIYFLAPRDRESDDDAVIRRLSARDAIPVLIENTYASGAVIGPEAIAEEFRMVSQLANNVPCFVIENRSTLERLEDLSERIADHVKGLGADHG